MLLTCWLGLNGERLDCIHDDEDYIGIEKC